MWWLVPFVFVSMLVIVNWVWAREWQRICIIHFPNISDKLFFLLWSFLTAIDGVDCFFDLFIVRDWLSLVPPTAAVAGLGYVSYMAFCPEARKSTKATRVNKSIRLEDAKVADFVDIEDIADKAAFCRCWKSKNVCITTNVLIVHTKCFAHFNRGTLTQNLAYKLNT